MKVFVLKRVYGDRTTSYLEDFEWIGDTKIDCWDCPLQSQSFQVFESREDAEDICEIVNKYSNRKYTVVEEEEVIDK